MASDPKTVGPAETKHWMPLVRPRKTVPPPGAGPACLEWVERCEYARTYYWYRDIGYLCWAGYATPRMSMPVKMATRRLPLLPPLCFLQTERQPSPINERLPSAR